MFGSAIPAKTERGRLALQERHFIGSRGQRALLIMVDGRRTLGRLAPVMASLGLSNEDLQALTDSGFMTWTCADGTRLSRHDAPVHFPFEVAEGLLVCLEQTRQLLGEIDAPLREAAAEIDNLAAFQRWLAMALAIVSSQRGAPAAASLRRTLMGRLDESLFSGAGNASTECVVDIVI